MPIPVEKVKNEVTPRGEVFKSVYKRPRVDESEAQTFDEIVFENRNRDYGAYRLRKAYSRNVLRGLGFAVTLAALVLALPAINKFLRGDDEIVKAAPKKLVYSELTMPPPIDKPKPPPPSVQLPKLQKVIKFVPPKVVKEEVIEEIPTITEIKQNQIADVEVEGATDIIFDEPAPQVVEESEEIFLVVEQQPEFPGGYDAMMNFILKNMVYPPAARKMGIEGTVHISFVVSKNGEISDVQVLRGISSDCDREAIRVVSKMPDWIPGKQNGRAVNVRFIMPLKFRLS